MAKREEEYKRLEIFYQMLVYYLDRPYSDTELGEEFNTTRGNIWRIRKVMLEELEIPLQESVEQRGKYFLRKDFQMRYIHFSPEEMASLYLAARRLQQQTKTSQEHVELALRKLANAMRKPFAESLTRAAGTIKEQEQDAEQQQIFSLLVKSWLEKTVIRIFHQTPHGARRDYIVHPYHIEPSMWGDGNYLIGYSEYHKKIARFKIARIDKVVLSGGPFREQTDFDVQEFLKHAWGIWSTESEPTTVRLRFSKWAIPLLKESVYANAVLHEPDQNGDCEWEVQVAEWREMESWVKGWGSKVEVLEPMELRIRLISETKRLAKKYEIISKPQEPSITRLLRCWGKTASEVETFHPALFHMLDVGNVAKVLLGDQASKRWKSILSKTLNVDSVSLIHWLPWVVAVHDIGKISASFQMQNKQQAERMIAEGFQFGDWPNGSEIYHAMISQAWLTDLFAQTNPKLGRVFQETFGEMLGGHHGRWVSRQKIGETTQLIKEYEPSEWEQLRSQADTLLRTKFLQGGLSALPQPDNISTAVMALTGFTILCDWLGSDSRFFQPAVDTAIEEYCIESELHANKALREYGFLDQTSSNAPMEAEILFADLGEARPLQRAINEIPNELLEKPILAIIEAPTGEGKTEAALTLAHRIAQYSGTDEFYCALPTMATSDEMFKRLTFHLHKRLQLSQQVKLVHGQAYLTEDELRSVAQMQFLESGEEVNSTEAVTWFNGNKKGLLAPFGVGTIDQVELAALNVKHLALRMMSLAGKVVIIDEVHAYDTYMTKILEQVLRWLSALNTSVILLSATLPKAKRKQLAVAYGCIENDPKLLADDYPNLLLSSNTQQPIWSKQPQTWQSNRTLYWQPLHFSDQQAREKADWLLDAIHSGGCACWITNTVRRAQRIFEHLRLKKQDDVQIFLLHSQFPLDERRQRVNQLSNLFGSKGEHRPCKAIVIGTQVLEQSLDLDFDVMVSDLAPIDLLLQRAGRLHRHPLKDRPRYCHTTPHLWVNFEQTEMSELKIGTDRSVYHPYFQRKTLLALSNALQINLPFDYRPLVEAVYDVIEPETASALYQDWRDLNDKEINASNQADIRLIPNPNPRSSFSIDATIKVKFEEDEDNAAWVVAKTRLGKESVSVIPLYVDGDMASLYPNSEPFPIDCEASQATQLEMLRRNLRVSYAHLVKAIKHVQNHRNTDLFAKSKLLKGFYPLWIEQNKITLTTPNDNFVLRLDPDLGLIPVNDEKENEE